MRARALLLCGLGAAGILMATGAQAYDLNNGRVLSSNCTQCHGTNQMPKKTGYGSLAGKSYSFILRGLNNYALKFNSSTKTCNTKNTNACLMAIHAQPYTSTDLQDIAWYLSRR